jgi:hypothetical protein
VDLKRVLMAVAVVCAMVAPAAHAQRYGDVEFPRDEHQHVDGWDFWWGAANVVTTSGNRYTVGVAWDSLNGVGLSGQEVFPHQGPYAGRMLATMDGAEEWGHDPQPAGRFVTTMSNHVPRVSELLRNEVRDTSAGGREIGRWQRTTLDRESYRLLVDNDAARVHPTGEHIALDVDIRADMQSPPLLAGGTGTWWYGLPEAHHYPSRSFQYMQAAKRLSGTLAIEQPDGTILRETIAPAGSKMVMTREYDAMPEDLPTGLALAEATQLHERYAQYYEGGMPWELVFLDLGNGAQLMLAVLAFHDSADGTIKPVAAPDQPTYRILATLRLPSGVSVPLDDELQVEHLSYKTLVGRVPTFWVAVKGIWKQAWEYRLRYDGGIVNGVDVPAFDLGLQPQFDRSWPAVDERGHGPTQRIPFVARGSYGGCPVDGFGWSELIVNWRGKRDPWWTGGELPPVPRRCDSATTAPPGGPAGELDPAPRKQPPPAIEPEGCQAFAPGAPACEYTATAPGGLGGNSADPGGWRVEIHREGQAEPDVITSFGGGHEMYACGTILPGDRVVATAEEGAGVFAGNPGICF